MKFGLRFALLAQTKCQNMAPRLSRVTRLSTSSPSYDYASEDCTVVFDADGVALRGRELSTCIRAHHLVHTGTSRSPEAALIARRRRRRSRERFSRAGAYCMEEAALMSRVNVENCVRDSANPARMRRPRSFAPRHRRDSPVDAPAGGGVRRPPEIQGAHGPHHPEEAQAEVADRDRRRLRGLLRGVHRPPALRRAQLSRVDTKTKHL